MTAETVTPAEARTITTLRADQLQPGDVVKLLSETGDSVNDIRLHAGGRCLVHLLSNGDHPYGASVWLWKYSRVEVLSDVSGRGHLVTPMRAEPEAY